MESPALRGHRKNIQQFTMLKTIVWRGGLVVLLVSHSLAICMALFSLDATIRAIASDAIIIADPSHTRFTIGMYFTAILTPAVSIAL